MEILFLSRLFYPHIGGVEKHVFEISQELMKRGHRVTVITENYDNLPLEETYKKIKIYRMQIDQNKNKKFQIWMWFFKHLPLILSVDIIHAHDVFFWYLPFRFLFPLKKIYTTFHGYEGNQTPNWRSVTMHKISEKLSYGNLCIGGFFPKWYGTRPTLVSFGAVKEEIIKAPTNTGSLTSIVYVGRLEEEAGVYEYLKGFKMIYDINKSYKLIILGDGSLKMKCVSFVKKYNLPVTFSGFVYDVVPYIKKSHIVFTSRYLGILEALALNKDVIAVYNNEIKKDYLTLSPMCRFIFICSSPSEIYQSVRDISSRKNDKKSSERRENAEQWIQNQTWETMVNNYMVLWNIL